MKAPKVKIYTVADTGVDVEKMKTHIKVFRANRVSTLQSEEINSVIFHVPITKISSVWKYLRKKRGIKKVILGL